MSGGQRAAAAGPTSPAPAVRVTNVRRPPAPPAAGDEHLHAPPPPAGGCASGECLPDAGAPQGPPPPPPRMPAARPVAGGPEAWRAAVEAVRAASSRHGASVAFGRLLSLRPGEVRLAYLPSMGFHRTQVTGASGRATVEKALSEHFGQPTRLVVETAGEAAAAAPPSLAEEEAQQRADHERSTEARVRAHPSVRAVLALLGGEVEHVQVLEPERPAPAAPPSPDTPEDIP